MANCSALANQNPISRDSTLKSVASKNVTDPDPDNIKLDIHLQYPVQWPRHMVKSPQSKFCEHPDHRNGQRDSLQYKTAYECVQKTLSILSIKSALTIFNLQKFQQYTNLFMMINQYPPQQKFMQSCFGFSIALLEHW